MDQQNLTLENYVDRLLEEKKMEVNDEEVNAQLREDLLSRVENHINAALLEAMPKNKLEQFDILLNNGQDSELQEFIKQNIENSQDVIAQALLKFRSIYLGVI